MWGWSRVNAASWPRSPPIYCELRLVFGIAIQEEDVVNELVVATGNRHKVEEIRAILAPAGIRVLSGPDVGGLPEVEEDGLTFEANAVKKAVAAAAACGRTVLADDSGLEVMALGGEPGVYSARYAGTDGDDLANLEKLLRVMKGVKDRSARFVCVLAVAGPDGLVGTAEGEVKGRILAAPRGENGFGYDPVFVPLGRQETFAELSDEQKNAMSHRGNALAAAVGNGLFEKAFGSVG